MDKPHAAPNVVPDWMGPFLWIFVGISGIGLVVSLGVHVGALLGHKVAPDALFPLLHAGIFVVWVPTVLLSRRTVGIVDQRNFWKVMLKPKWLRYVVFVFTAYALINFLFFITKVPRGVKGNQDPIELWRGFSGHWMAFYSAAFAILYSVTQRRGRDET